MAEERSRRPAQPEVQPPPGLEARRAALDILTLIRGGRTLDEALSDCRSFTALEGSDRALARLVATTVLRRRGGLDHIIGGYIDRPLPKRAARAIDILRLTAAQLLMLGTPAHAAVSIAVALTKDFKETEGYAGLVNAISRKMAKFGPAALDGLSPRIDTPAWMWRGWERRFGPSVARRIAAAHQKEPFLDLTVKDAEETDELATELAGAILPTGSLRLEGAKSVAQLAGYAEGRWWVQDAAAALPARLLGSVSGKRVFDLCAAPGGKTMQLAAAGATVTAVDQAGLRLKLLAENLERTKLSATLIKDDATSWRPDEKANAILLDAPCSATGTIRRHPDILWSKSEDDVEALAKLQSRMIDHAASLLKPGGVLVYCVCSLQPEEGEAQAAAAFKRRSDLQRSPIKAEELSLPEEAINANGELRTFPYMMGGVDGFFAFRARVC